MDCVTKDVLEYILTGTPQSWSNISNGSVTDVDRYSNIRSEAWYLRINTIRVFAGVNGSKIGSGEQSGTWGDTTNTNFDIVDKLTNGAVIEIDVASNTTSNLDTTDSVTVD